MPIHFFSEGITFSLREKSHHKNWLKSIILDGDLKLGALNFVFCDDDYLHQINVDYLNHDTFTDIVTFDNSIESDEISGDLFISIDRVKENALSMKITPEEELDRVMIHGVLHLMGFNDKTEKEKQEIRKKEDHCLSLRTF